MKQVWHDLLFAHWPVAFDDIRRLVPSQLELDTFDGQCWVGVIPFWMSGVRARGMPAVPGLSRFPELNVRTYVTYGGKSGVYFFSLDAANLPAVWAARRFYHLPYFHSEMSALQQAGTIHYKCQRLEAEALFRGRYKPISPVAIREKGSLADWLTSRYCLYTVHENRVCRGEIHHLPWPLQDAEAEIERNTMASAAAIHLPHATPLLHFSRHLEVLIWPLRDADGRSPQALKGIDCLAYTRPLRAALPQQHPDSSSTLENSKKLHPAYNSAFRLEK